MTEQWRFGDFGHRVVVGAFEPDPADMLVDGTHHGLNQQATWLYGFFRDADGLTYCIERKFVGSLTSGCFVMTQDGDRSNELNVHPDSGRSARGELRRVLDPDVRRWSDPVFQRLPAGTLPAGEQPMELEFRRRQMRYGEGDILDLAGEAAGLGMQFFAPSADQPLLYTSCCFWMTGKIQGREVYGPLWFDNSFWRHGLEWKEYGYFNDKQIMWHIFCNKFDDGSFEWGHLVTGRDGFNPGIVISSDGRVDMTPQLESKFALDEKAWPTGARYVVNDDVFEFVGPETGRMTQFSESRWAGYRAQYGQTRRAGDERELEDGFTWLEGFTNRLDADGNPA